VFLAFFWGFRLFCFIWRCYCWLGMGFDGLVAGYVFNFLVKGYCASV